MHTEQDIMLTKIIRLPLSVKLSLIILIPILLTIYFALRIYKEKSLKLEMIRESITLVNESEYVQKLIVALALERRGTFNYIQENDSLQKLLHLQAQTDSLIEQNEANNFSHKNFTKYTFLDQLNEIRAQVKNNAGYSVVDLIQYYTHAIDRVNFLDGAIPRSKFFQKRTYQNMYAQNIISNMLTKLSNARSNIYNVLNNKIPGTGYQLTTSDDYKIYKSYETELRLNSSQNIVQRFDSITSLTAFKEMILSMDKAFTGKSIVADTLLNSKKWWDLSALALTPLRNLQTDLFTESKQQLDTLYAKEIFSRKKSMILLFISIGVVIIIAITFALSIIRILKQLESAAYEIAKGATGIQIKTIPSGILGSVARSILKIEENNLQLARAASEIGKGNFDAPVNARSDKDLLGHSLKKMKHDLKEFNSQKDKIQKETMQLVYDRDEFFSMTSHELKTPVTSLKAYTQLLLMDEFAIGKGQSREMLEKMDNQINKLVKLINDLLDTSKMQYGILDYHKKPLKINNLVGEVIKDSLLSNKDHKIIFQKNVNAMVLGDEDRIRQVIFNILNNAIKYGPDSKEIIIRLEKNNNNIIFSAKDFGYGIKEEDKPQIFDRFFRASGDNLHTFPGLGVGLYISNEIIKQHGGRMWLESEYKMGSTFFFELPLSFTDMG